MITLKEINDNIYIEVSKILEKEELIWMNMQKVCFMMI